MGIIRAEISLNVKLVENVKNVLIEYD